MKYISYHIARCKGLSIEKALQPFAGCNACFCIFSCVRTDLLGYFQSNLEAAIFAFGYQNRSVMTVHNLLHDKQT